MKRFIVKNILGGGDNRLNKENDYPKKYKQIHILLFSIICILFIVGIFFIQDRETNNLLTKNSNTLILLFISMAYLLALFQDKTQNILWIQVLPIVRMELFQVGIIRLGVL